MRKAIRKYILVIIILLFPFAGLVFDFIYDSFPYTRYKGYTFYSITSLEERPPLIFLRKGRIIREKFATDVVELDSVEIRYRSKGNNRGLIYINVYDINTGERVASWVQDLSELHGSQIVSYPFTYYGYKGERQKKDYELELIGADRFNRVGVARAGSAKVIVTDTNKSESEDNVQFAVVGISEDISMYFTRFWIQIYFCCFLAVLVFNVDLIKGIFRKKRWYA